ncbi:MAG: hypothetical protein HYS26_04890 [Candidatus Kaiserbacteria bacterium]|nr:MAG: hypothetical protein HYS26_04890 [Candidatus Kaiserbacteria bacterium]
MIVEHPDSHDAFKNPDAAAIDLAVGHAKNTIEKYGAAEWAKVKQDIQKASPEEQMAAETGIAFLQAIRDVDKPTATLQRIARQLPEMARATKVFEQHSNSDVAHAMKRLTDAAYPFATREMQQEAGIAFGAMTPEELEAARQRALKISVR